MSEREVSSEKHPTRRTGVQPSPFRTVSIQRKYGSRILFYSLIPLWLQTLVFELINQFKKKKRTVDMTRDTKSLNAFGAGLKVRGVKDPTNTNRRRETYDHNHTRRVDGSRVYKDTVRTLKFCLLRIPLDSFTEGIWIKIHGSTRLSLSPVLFSQTPTRWDFRPG